jgi:hypothetical protein
MMNRFGPFQKVGAMRYHAAMRNLVYLALVLLLLGSGCITEIVGIVVPDSECQTPLDGELSTQGVFDVGPTESLANSLDVVVFVKGGANARITEASVSFQDKNSDPLPTEVDGVKLTLPHVEFGEREEKVDGTLNDDGIGTFSFPLVTRKEAEQFQLLTAVDEDLEVIAELQIRAEVTTTEPYFHRLRLCQQCLVGKGANVENEAFVCPDGSAPIATDPAPCQKGRDEVWSACKK